MADLRLVGRNLAAARMLAETPYVRDLLWRFVSKDFRVAELDALPATGRGRVEEVPRPVQGAPPRKWGDGEDLGAPRVSPGRGAALRAAYAAGTSSPVDVCERLLGRLDRGDFGPSTWSPFVAVDAAGAGGAAAASAARWASGAPLGPLDGIPVPIKDEFHQRGLPTRGGTSWRNEPATVDAFLVRRLRDAGALLVGKAHATENGMNPLGYNAHFDYPRNAWSAEHGAGGSSTGSAVAVALGLAPVAIGTDGGGSIRIPAALNGVFGLKPTFLRLGRTGGIWLGTVGHAGPIGRSTSDLVDLMEVCAARDPDDPLTHFAPDWGAVESTWRPALGRGVRGCRIGVLAGELAEADPAIARACTAALDALAAEGAVLVNLEVPLFDLSNAVGPLVIAGESAANAWDDLRAHRSEFGEELRLIYALMQCVTAQDHLRATRVRDQLRLELACAISGVDVLALPSHAKLAPSYPRAENRVEVADTATTGAMTRFNFAGNLTGLPAASVPVGVHDGLPIGLQILGDAWDEASVLAVCAHLERIGVTDIGRSPGFVDPLAAG